MVIGMEKEDFIRRMAQLRLNKDVSARDMSLSLGQSPNYINGIENGGSYPSMTNFFYICEYFGITSKEFFDVDTPNPVKLDEPVQAAKRLTNEQPDHLIALVKTMQ
jgi:transcriptional regulator with XRE-family HTH domain